MLVEDVGALLLLCCSQADVTSALSGQGRVRHSGVAPFRWALPIRHTL